MKSSQVIVPWPEGLHLRYAVKVVQIARRFKAITCLKCGGQVADLRSILGVIALCATLGTPLVVEANGDDEQDAVQAIEQLFTVQASGDSAGPTYEQRP